MIGSVPSEHARTAHTILQNIFILNKSRGEHASGFSALHTRKDGRLITEKRAISSIKFVERSAKFKALGKDMPNIFIGHTRFSTSGTPSRGRNNHPFNSSKYSMVHNGGIDRWQTVVEENDLNLRSETDSEVILRLAEKRDNFHDGISHAMDALGYGSRVAVAFLQHEGEPRLFLFRNIMQPISIMTYPRLHTIFFSSERQHLQVALRSVYGNSVNEIMQEHEINIESIPDWKSLEFRLSVKGLPEIAEEKSIIRTKLSSSTSSSSSLSTASTRTMGFNYHTRGILVDNDSESSTLPVCVGSTRKTLLLPNPEPENMSTGELLKEASTETREQSVQLAKTVREASQVLNCIRENRFMQFKEIEHFKKWMKLV